MDRNRQILRLAIPSVAASLSVPIIGIADTILVGHLDEVYMLGAVSVGAVVFDVVFWGLGFFRMGTTALVAQSYGARDLGGCRSVLVLSSTIAIGLGLALILLKGPIADLGFGLTGPSDDVSQWGRRYLDVRIISAPFVLVTFVLTGFFRGCGDAMSPLWITVLANVTNVFLDWVLIYGQWGAPALGAVGAGWASVAANVVGLTLGVVLLVRRNRNILSTQGKYFDLSLAPKILTTNGHLFGRTACLLFTQFFGMAMVSRMGDVPLATHAVAWQIWSVVSYFVDGFAHAAETLVGNALGALNQTEAVAFGRRCMVWGTGIGLGFGLLYGLGMEPIARQFTNHQEVVVGVLGLTLLIAVIQPLSGAVYVLDGILIGANDTRYLFIAMAMGAFGVYLPVILWVKGSVTLGLWGVWLAYNALMISRFLFLWLRFRGKRWQEPIVGHFA